jgi:imidazolonepropionase-like amidohydrolase
METYDATACRKVAQVLARNSTWLVPTLVLHHGRLLSFDSTVVRDPRLAHVDAATLARLMRARPETDVPAQRQAERIKFMRYMQSVVATMQRAGAPILAGTDLGNPSVTPGFSLHDELALFVDGGMTPLDALRTATLNPARYLAATDTMGSIAGGKVADIVLLDANPLDDIRNTMRIHAVIVNGRVLDRARLDGLITGRPVAH